jgi:hypothetical protein
MATNSQHWPHFKHAPLMVQAGRLTSLSILDKQLEINTTGRSNRYISRRKK